MAKDADALVIGAGISGLIAARELARGGLRVELVEARTVLGGRIATFRSPEWPLPIELGAEFVHGRPDATLRLLEEHGLSLDPLADVHHRRVEGRLTREQGFWDKVGGILEKRNPGSDQSAAELLGSASIEREEADLFRLIVEGFHAAPVEDVSVESLASDASTSGGAEDEVQQRPREGYGPLIEKLAASVDPGRVTISRGAPVRGIEWKKGAVAASVERAGRPVTLAAPCAVITVSVGALQEAPESGIRFSPDIESKRSALSRLAMGHVVKVVMCFSAAFWKGAPPDFEFLHDGTQPFATFWRVPAGERVMFVAWAGGPRASALADRSASYLVPLALESLCQVLGADVEDGRARLVGSAAHSFSGDPFVRGAYSYVRPGGKEARASLAASLDDTLFFAGEATDAENPATVAGAIASGERAAREVLASR